MAPTSTPHGVPTLSSTTDWEREDRLSATSSFQTPYNTPRGSHLLPNTDPPQKAIRRTAKRENVSTGLAGVREQSRSASGWERGVPVP